MSSRTHGLEAMPHHYEQAHPLSRNPKGWFAVDLTKDLAAGIVKPVSALGRNLVVFRTAAGAVGVLDAYCPHLGAHLGYGGRVDGETLRCPFHHWAFGADGRCASIPYAREIPGRAAVRSYPVVERNGAVLAWFAPDGTAPEWDVPEAPSTSWSATRWLDFTCEAHIQEFAENGVDKAHFPIVHGSKRAGVEIIDPIGVPFRFKLSTAYPGDGIGLPGQHIDVESDWSYYGPGIFVGVSTAEEFGTQIRQIFHFTPLPGDEVLIRVAIAANLETIPLEMLEEVQDKNAQILLQNFDEDREIWRRKRYRQRPVLCAEDGPFGTLRRWTRQFYVGDDGLSMTDATSSAAAASASLRPADMAGDVAQPVPPSTQAAPPAAPSQHPTRPTTGSIATVYDTIFVQLPASFDARAANGRDFVIQYHISGRAGGSYNVTVSDGVCTPCEGEHRSPTVSVFVEDEDWLKINAGTLNRAKAFMSGRLRVKGDMKLAYRLGDIFRA